MLTVYDFELDENNTFLNDLKFIEEISILSSELNSAILEAHFGIKKYDWPSSGFG